MTFIDVPGASGARYRFRHVAADALPVSAGNIVAVADEPRQPRFVLCATASSLARSAPAVHAALQDALGVRLYIRLNVNRAARDAEHADIVQAVEPGLAIADLA